MYNFYNFQRLHKDAYEVEYAAYKLEKKLEADAAKKEFMVTKTCVFNQEIFEKNIATFVSDSYVSFSIVEQESFWNIFHDN